MNRILKTKPTFRQPDVTDLKHKLDTLDVSTNKYIHTTTHTVPLNNKQYHPTLGVVSQAHPKMQDLIELTEFQVGTTAHRHIRSWKRRLRGTIITKVNNDPITCVNDIKDTVQRACSKKQKNITIGFGSLVGFAMSGKGALTLHTDQLNVIAHHLNEINTEQDL